MARSTGLIFLLLKEGYAEVRCKNKKPVSIWI
jgi:hypothetical protein